MDVSKAQKVSTDQQNADPVKKSGKQSSRSKKVPNTFLDRRQAGVYVYKSIIAAKQLIHRQGSRTVKDWLSRISRWMMRQEMGMRKDARTPYLHNVPYPRIAESLNKLIRINTSKSEKLVGKDGFHAIKTAEIHNLKKFGPKGTFKPAHLWMPEKVKAVWSDKTFSEDCDLAALDRVLERVANAVPAGSINEGDFEAMFPGGGGRDEPETDGVLNIHTNSCFPTCVRNWFHRVWDNTVTVYQRATQLILTEEAKFWRERLMHARKWSDVTQHWVAIANMRTVAQGLVDRYQGVWLAKPRLVIAMPKREALLLKPILNQVQEACKELRAPSGIRIFNALCPPEVIDKTQQVILEHAAKAGRVPLCTDFSGFDATIPPELMWKAALAMSKWMTPKAQNIFLNCIYTMIYRTALLTPYGYTEEGPSSQKSGGMFTNNLDSICHLIAQWYGEETGRWTIESNEVQGDDGVLDGEGINAAVFSKVVSELGFVANIDKQWSYPNTISYLQKIHTLGCPGGVYPIARAINSCLSLEDDVRLETEDYAIDKFPYILAFRSRARYDNCCFNPNFVEGAKWLVNADTKWHLLVNEDPQRIERLAGTYAMRWEDEWALKPWKSPGVNNKKFVGRPINRVLSGEVPPPPGKDRFQWVYGVSYDSVAI